MATRDGGGGGGDQDRDLYYARSKTTDATTTTTTTTSGEESDVAGDGQAEGLLEELSAIGFSTGTWSLHRYGYAKVRAMLDLLLDELNEPDCDIEEPARMLAFRLKNGAPARRFRIERTAPAGPPKVDYSGWITPRQRQAEAERQARHPSQD